MRHCSWFWPRHMGVRTVQVPFFPFLRYFHSLSIRPSLCAHKQPTQQLRLLTLFCETAGIWARTIYSHVPRRLMKYVPLSVKREGEMCWKKRETKLEKVIQCKTTYNIFQCGLTFQQSLLHGQKPRLQRWGGALPWEWEDVRSVDHHYGSERREDGRIMRMRRRGGDGTNKGGG